MFRLYILAIFMKCLYMYYTKFLHGSTIYILAIFMECSYICYIKFLHGSTIYPGHLHGVFVYLLYKIPTRFDHISWPSSWSVCICITQNSYTVRLCILAIFMECSYICYIKFLHGSTIYPFHLQTI